MANKNLANAKKVKNDEFYTQYPDIQKEIEAYLEYNPDVFRDKVVYCNCDDPYESNFFRYFVLNFNKLGLKRLITTSYKPSPIADTQLKLLDDKELESKSKGRPKVTAKKFIINEVKDVDGDGEFNLKDIAQQLQMNKNNEWTPLEEDGDFRSKESVELLKQSDIVVTNPPFSLFREYIKQLKVILMQLHIRRFFHFLGITKFGWGTIIKLMLGLCFLKYQKQLQIWNKFVK